MSGGKTNIILKNFFYDDYILDITNYYEYFTKNIKNPL